ncbi:MAG: peptidoglycan-binding protein [Deltaproteobacteria bacterium]|nr:peptidoglycan-binding protein [Deltaproteobacteria bacterium]
MGKIDGKYGSKTAKAIKAFQKEHQLKVDGKLSESLLERVKAAGASTGQQTQ